MRSRRMVLYPYYALFQALLLPPLGALYYLWLWCKRGTLKPPGRYRIGLRRGGTLDLSLWEPPAGPRIAWVAKVMRVTALR